MRNKIPFARTSEGGQFGRRGVPIKAVQPSDLFSMFKTHHCHQCALQTFLLTQVKVFVTEDNRARCVGAALI